MNTQEALDLLATAISDGHPSRVNKTLTRAQAVEIMRASVVGGVLDGPRTDNTIHKIALIEKNVRRVAADRRRL